jgi:hypothetical protein
MRRGDERHALLSSSSPQCRFVRGEAVIHLLIHRRREPNDAPSKREIGCVSGL